MHTYLQAVTVFLCGVPVLQRDAPLDALEQALWGRNQERDGRIHHSDRSLQYLSIRYTEHLVEAGIEPSVSSRGDSYDNALAETVVGRFKTEVIRPSGPYRGLEAVELTITERVWWFNRSQRETMILFVI